MTTSMSQTEHRVQLELFRSLARIQGSVVLSYLERARTRRTCHPSTTVRGCLEDACSGLVTSTPRSQAPSGHSAQQAALPFIVVASCPYRPFELRPWYCPRKALSLSGRSRARRDVEALEPWKMTSYVITDSPAIIATSTINQPVCPTRHRHMLR